MSSTFATQWSAALGLDIANVTANSQGLQQLGQKMADFIGVRAQQSVLDKLNTTLGDYTLGSQSAPRLVIENSLGVVVNEQTLQLADAFLVDAKHAMEGTWPSAWNSGLKDPALMLIAYLSAAAVQTNKDHVEWTWAVTKMVEVYTMTYGPTALMAEVNALDQLLPQVLTGAASALLDTEGMDRMHQALKAMKPASNDFRPQPAALLQVLLDSRAPSASELTI